MQVTNLVTGQEIKMKLIYRNGPFTGDNSLIIDGPISLIAIFSPSDFTLSALSQPLTGGYVEGTGGFTLLDSLSRKSSAQPLLGVFGIGLEIRIFLYLQILRNP